MADTDIWMPLYVGDYLSDTRHLNTTEHGAYLLLIMYAWTHAGTIPADSERLRRITGLSPREWKASWPTIREFFFSDHDGFRHARIDREIARQKEKVGKRRDAANARWEKQKQSKSNANASGLHMQNGINAYENQNQNQNQNQKEEEEGENPPTPHGALAFSGRIIRVNRRDFNDWVSTYHAIIDLRAELQSLDDWMRDEDDPTIAKRWRQIVSKQLAKKHQAALTSAKRMDDDDDYGRPIC